MNILLRFILSFFVLNLMLLGLGVFSSKQIENTASFIDEIYEKPLQSINFARTAQSDFSQLELRVSQANNKKRYDEKTLAAIDESIDLFKENLEIAKERSISEDSKEPLQSIESSLVQWVTLKNAVIAGEKNYDALLPIADAIQEGLSELVEFEATAGYDFVIDASDKSAESKTFNLIVSIIAFCIGTLISLLLAFNITHPIKRSVKFAQSIAQGDFTTSIETTRKDELGFLIRSLKTMQEKLIDSMAQQKENEEKQRVSEQKQRDVEQEVQRTKEENEESERQKQREYELENKRAAEKREKRAREQMAQMSEALKKELNKTIVAISDNSQRALESVHRLNSAISTAQDDSNLIKTSSEEASQNSEDVVHASNELSLTIHEISEQMSVATDITQKAVMKTTESVAMISELSDTAKGISTIVALITDIAEQTNLLALNATIEAVRAGEAGKGFSVVAAEVKNLAEQTAQATKDIVKQVACIYEKSDLSVHAIQEVEKIISEVGGVSLSISAAIEEQSLATAGINENTISASKSALFVHDKMNDISAHFDVAQKMSDDLLNKTDSVRLEVEELRHNIVRIVYQKEDADRRKHKRFTCENYTASIVIKGKKHPLNIKNISCGGLRAAPLPHLPKGAQNCLITLPGFPLPVQAKIIDSTDDRLRFIFKTDAALQKELLEFLSGKFKKSSKKVA